MLLKSTIKRVCEVMKKLGKFWSKIPGHETHWFSLQQEDTPLCFHVEKKTPKTNNPA